jgi:hypothetical protein
MASRTVAEEPTRHSPAETAASKDGGKASGRGTSFSRHNSVRWSHHSSAKQDLDRFSVDLGRGVRGHVEEARLERRGAAADAELQAATAELIQHAHLLENPQGMLEAQDGDQRAERQTGGPLRNRGEEYARRRRRAERRSVVLGQVVGVQTGPIVMLGQREPVGILPPDIGIGSARTVEMVEYSEFHKPPPVRQCPTGPVAPPELRRAHAVALLRC